MFRSHRSGRAKMTTGRFLFKFHTFLVFLFRVGGKNETLMRLKREGLRALVTLGWKVMCPMLGFREPQLIPRTWFEDSIGWDCGRVWYQASYGPGWLWTRYSWGWLWASDLSIPPKCCDYRCVPPCLLAALGMNAGLLRGVKGMHRHAQHLVSFFHWLFQLVSVYLPGFEVSTGADTGIPGLNSPGYSDHLSSTYLDLVHSQKRIFWACRSHDV